MISKAVTDNLEHGGVEVCRRTQVQYSSEEQITIKFIQCIFFLVYTVLVSQLIDIKNNGDIRFKSVYVDV